MIQKNDEETPEQPLEDTLTEKTDEINPMEMSSEEKSNTEPVPPAALAPTPVLELTHTPEPEKNKKKMKKYSDSEEEENEQNSNTEQTLQTSGNRERRRENQNLELLVIMLVRAARHQSRQGAWLPLLTSLTTWSVRSPQCHKLYISL